MVNCADAAGYQSFIQPKKTMTDFRRGFIAAAVLSLSTGLAGAQPYLISTYAGGLAAPTSAAATSYAFENPNGVATDAFGNTYFTTGYNCVFRLDANRKLSRVAGNCRTGYLGDSGNALNAELNNPQGIALDALGNLYIADQGNQVIRKVTPSGIITTFAGNGTAGYSGDNGQATGAELNSPQGVVVDPAGNVYIADSGNHRIRMVNTSGIITTIAGSSSPGTGGDGGAATAATFTDPTNLALDSKGDLYITDTGASVVRMINTSGTISHIAGTGSATYNGDGQPAVSAALSVPQGLALDAAGNLYIADTGNHSVRVIAVGGDIATYAGNYQRFGDTGDGGPATAAELFSPTGVATDYAGNLYIADQSEGVVRTVNSSGTITTVAGNSGAPNPFYGDGGPAALADFATPWGIAFDTSGNLYVADFKNSRVRKITPTGVGTTGLVTTFAGNGVSSDSGNGGPATSASVTPHTLAVDSSNNVYLADNAVIRKIAGGTISTVAGTGVAGYSGDNGSALSAELGGYLPGLAVDNNSPPNIYIADWSNQRVRKVTTSTGVISTIAGTGTAGYTGEGTATAVELNFPAGLVFDATTGNLYIADNGNCRVRMVTSGGTISTVAGNGTCGSTGDSGAPTAAEINYPVALALDGAGNLYIAEENPITSSQYRIRKVSGGNITTIAGNGTAGYSGDGGLATGAQLNNPSGLAVDAAGNVYISDFANGAVRVLQPETEPLLTAASTHTGSFPPSGTGTFSISVSDAALAAASAGQITVTATLPASLTPVSMSGTGWTCSTSVPYHCNGSGNSLGTITLTVNVASNAPPQVTNEVVVSGGGALATGSEDLALVGSATPVLQISATHSGDFVIGAQGTFTITVGNQIAAASTSGTVTVSDTLLPATGLTGLTLSSLSSTWICSGTSCNNNTPIAGGGNFPPITGTVNVAANAGSPLTNTATASGGGSSVSPSSADTIYVVSTSCAVNGQGSFTVSDVQSIINQGLGKNKASNDINQDGVVNVVDIQAVINAVLYSTCKG